jgi:aminopeptidase N
MSGSIVNPPTSTTATTTTAATTFPMTTTLRGGGGLLSSAATDDAIAEAAATAAPVEIFRADYEPLPYKVTNVSMNFIIRDGKTTVHTEMKIVPNDDDATTESTTTHPNNTEDGVGVVGSSSSRGDMIMNGEASAISSLHSIRLNGIELVDGTDYTIVGDALLLPSCTLNDGGVLYTIVDIVPETNTQLSGLYKSGDKMYCTQCEAMG